MNNSAKKGSFLLKIKDFFKKHMRLWYISITVLLLLLLLGALSVKVALNIVTVESLDGSELDNIILYGYVPSQTESGNTLYTPNNDDPMVMFTPPRGQTFNAVTIYYKEPVQSTQTVELFYSYAGEPFSQEARLMGAIASNKTQLTTLVNETTYAAMRFDINYPFTLERIAFESRYMSYSYDSTNLICAIVFAVGLLALLIVERKFKYYAFIGGSFKRLVCSTVALFKSKAYVRGVIRTIEALSFIALGVCTFAFMATTNHSFGSIICIFVLSLLSVGLFIADSLFSKEMNAPILFLVIALVFGFMLSFCLPPTQYNSWDEAYHFDRCVDLRCMFLGSEKTSSDCYHIFSDVDKYFENMDTMQTTLIGFDQVPVNTPDQKVDIYKSLGYIPSSITMFVSDLFDFNFIIMVILCRMSNILLYSFVLFAGIKRLKSGQLLLSTIFLLPTAIFIASAFSYDYFVNAFIGYGYAYFISELQCPEKKLTVKDAILMLGAMLLGCGPKAIYFLLVLPMLFIGSHKFDSKKAHRIYQIACIAVMLIALMSFIVPFITNTDASSDLRGGEDVNALEQVKFILKNPIKYAGILIRFMGEYVSFHTASEFASSYAYIGTPSTIYGTIGICLILLCTFFDKSDCDSFTKRARFNIITLCTVFVQLALVATALYVSFTPVGHSTVNGCQWRYVIPMFIPFLYPLRTSKIKISLNEKLAYGVVYGALYFTLFASFSDIYISKILLM